MSILREAFLVTLLNPVEKKNFTVFPPVDESSSISHISSALEVACGQIGAHAAAQFCC